MSENMGSRGYTSNEKFIRLYGRWAEGGIGLLITGNVYLSYSSWTGLIEGCANIDCSS